MTTNMRALVAAALVVSFHAGQAGAREYACTVGDLQRSVQVVYEIPDAPVPCEVRYAKSGQQAQSLWRAEHEHGYCERQAVGLIQKLSDAGWSCAAVGVDDSPEVAAAELAEAAPADDAAADVDADPQPDASADAAADVDADPQPDAADKE